MMTTKSDLLQFFLNGIIYYNGKNKAQDNICSLLNKSFLTYLAVAKTKSSKEFKLL